MATQFIDKENLKPAMTSVKDKNVQKASEAYISPSDAILSPATQKLAAFKHKKLGKGLKPQTLFARAMSNSQAARGSSSASPPDGVENAQQQSQSRMAMFADLPTQQQQQQQQQEGEALKESS